MKAPSKNRKNIIGIIFILIFNMLYLFILIPPIVNLIIFGIIFIFLFFYLIASSKSTNLRNMFGLLLIIIGAIYIINFLFWILILENQYEEEMSWGPSMSGIYFLVSFQGAIIGGILGILGIYCIMKKK